MIVELKEPSYTQFPVHMEKVWQEIYTLNAKMIKQKLKA